jgi:predicted O-methyltransferase YrrM
MKINSRIPGWNSNDILVILGKHAASIPENGLIVELGALFGRSTYVLGHNKKASVKLISIDIWPNLDKKNHTVVNYHDNDCGKEELELVLSKFNTNGILPGTEFYSLWKTFTADIVNIEGIRDFTNLDNTNYAPIDLIFHDASHEYEGVRDDLIHWFPKLKSDGIMIIDDYEPQFPGVVRAVDEYIAEHDLEKEMVTHRNILIKRKTK